MARAQFDGIDHQPGPARPSRTGCRKRRGAEADRQSIAGFHQSDRDSQVGQSLSLNCNVAALMSIFDSQIDQRKRRPRWAVTSVGASGQWAIINLVPAL
jgi:hypothetical protein